MVISTPCKFVTPKNFNLKLCIRDYIGESTYHANFGSNRYSEGFSPYRRNTTTLWLYPVLPCPFFLGNVPRLNREPIFTVYGSNDVFPCKEVPFGGYDNGWRHLEEICPKTPKKWAWIGNFKPKWQNIKITISPKLWIRSRPNLKTNLRPTIALRGWSNVIQINSNMAAGLHLEIIDMTS